MSKFGTETYNRKYEEKNEANPRSVVTYFVDGFLTQATNCLDLGSGAGRHSKYLAEKGIAVTAIDLSETGVKKTKEILSDFPTAHAVIGDVHTLPFADQTFDSLICNRVLDYNDDAGVDVAFTEIARVVRDEGLVLLTVRSVSQQPKPDEVLLSENPNHGKSFTVAGGPQVQHYFTESEIKTLAEKHGLTVVEMREVSHVNSENEEKAEWQTIMIKSPRKR